MGKTTFIEELQNTPATRLNEFIYDLPPSVPGLESIDSLKETPFIPGVTYRFALKYIREVNLPPTYSAEELTEAKKQITYALLHSVYGEVRDLILRELTALAYETREWETQKKLLQLRKDLLEMTEL